MTISVEISDRQYDYIDEEKAAKAIADYQEDHDLSDQDIISTWNEKTAPLYKGLFNCLLSAIEARSAVKFARMNMPYGINLCICQE